MFPIILAFQLVFFSCQYVQANNFIPDFGLKIHNFNYREEVNKPGKSEESGSYFSIYGKLNYSRKDWSTFNFDFSIEGSPEVNLQYDGTSQAPAYTPIQSTNKHFFINTEALIHAQIVENYSIDFGFSNRYWQRRLMGGTEFKEIYVTNFLMLGTTFLLFENEFWDVKGVFRFKRLLTGTIDVIFSDTVINGQNSKMNLSSRDGYYFEIPLEYALNDSVALKFFTWYESFGFGRSESVYNGTSGIQTNIYEPSSITVDYGLGAGIIITDW